MITGFNTDIPFEGVTYHVQTEDKGLDTPLILSLVYVGGAIIASKRTPYEDLLSKGYDEKVLTERLQRQHKLICAAIKAGRVDDLKRMAGAAAATENGDAKAEHKPTAEGGVKSAGSRRKKATAQPRVEAGATVEEKAVKDKAAEDERAVVEEAGTAPVGGVEKRPEAAGGVAPLDFGLDLLTNLVDEVSALGEAQERATAAAETQAAAHEAATHAEEESPVEASHATAVPSGSEPLKVEPLPLSARGAPEAPAVLEELYLSLLDDEGDFRAGQLATIKVHVGRGAYGRAPVAGASVTVKVLGTTFRPLILTTDTDERGLAIVRALLPRFTSGRAALIIRATLGEEFSEIRRIIHQ